MSAALPRVERDVGRRRAAVFPVLPLLPLLSALALGSVVAPGVAWAAGGSGDAASVAAPSAAAPSAAAPAPRAGAMARAPSARQLRLELAAALEHHAARRFADARAAFLRALEVAPADADRASLEFNIAACDYELGAYREAEARFVRVASAAPETRGSALLWAGWAALAAGDDAAAQAHLDAASAGQTALAAEGLELARAIAAARERREAAELARDVEAATRAYQAGQRERARDLVLAARAREPSGTPRSRATLAYLEALLAHERGEDETARRALERSVREDPSDGAPRIFLAELALERGDRADAERQYRASLGVDLSPRDETSVRDALAALYGLPARGLTAWASLGAGYDTNATLSGSSEAIGYAGPARQGSAFTAPAWSVEQRWASGERSRLGAYYAGDWLVLASAASASLMTHEAGVRYSLAPSASTELGVSAGAGPTFSGTGLSPFSLDARTHARFALHHSARWRTHLSAELSPSVGFGEQSSLGGLRAELGAGERFRSGRWSAGLGGSYRVNAIGTWSLPLASRVPGCVTRCDDARHRVPLGYQGPIVDADVGVELAAGLELGTWLRYERRAFLDESRIEGDDVPALVQRLSRKTRQDDRYGLGARARYRLGDSPELGAWLRYALRLSRSNVALGRGGVEHVFDYDDRNFDQHVLELGLDARY